MAGKIDDAGHAFPSPDWNGDWRGPDANHGMSMRDWFAGLALTSIISATSAGQHRVLFGENGETIEAAMAKDAYAVADAMIAARKGGA